MCFDYNRENLVIDLHSHTCYSNCGRDEPEELILEMIKREVDVLGITDHNHGINERGVKYRNEIRNLAKKYKDKIKIFCGIEVCTHNEYQLRYEKDLAEYDYCLIENLSSEDTITEGDILSYSSQFKCVKGIAHTDIFNFAKTKKLNIKAYLQSLAKAGIFWELNVSFDSIHHYKEHEYVKTFFNSPEQQELVKNSNLYISVGFDGHRKEDYCMNRVRDANEFLRKNKINNAINLLNK